MIRPLALAFGLILFSLAPAAAMTIERVTTPGGIEAWLVEEHAVPVIAVEIGFRGGARVEPDGREGLADMMMALLDEGAGDLDAEAFQKRLEERAISLGFDGGRDGVYASLRTLSGEREEGFRLLGLALRAPRFDDEPVARVRSQLLAQLKRQAEDPDTVAAKRWFSAAFPDHPYGRDSSGSEASLRAISVDDLKAFAARSLARDRMKIAVVGDIDRRTLARLLDAALLGLPASSPADETPEAVPTGKARLLVERRPLPQTVVVFGSAGLKRADPDYIPAFVLNYMMGGGGFASRLTEEVREKRGLAYSVYSYLLPLDHAGLVLGGLATENAHVKDAIALVRAEQRRMLTKGVSAEELKNAKTYLTGSYPLRFDTNAKIASELVGIQLEDLGIDYVDKRNALIEAVTLEDLKRVAPRVLDPDGLLVSVVGDPKGL